jgi:hypothetical protein
LAYLQQITNQSNPAIATDLKRSGERRSVQALTRESIKPDSLRKRNHPMIGGSFTVAGLNEFSHLCRRHARIVQVGARHLRDSRSKNPESCVAE